MNINSQRLDYKINRIDLNYSRKFEENMADSGSSFSAIQTPGWSSMIKSQISERNKNNHQKNMGLREKIMSKLNNKQQINWTPEHEAKMITSQNAANYSTKDTNKIKYRLKDESIQKENQSLSRQKRFNAINVHEHLYQQGIKQQNKRILRKLVDEEIKKKQILTFRPAINEKSAQLAQIKFSRAQQMRRQIQQSYHKQSQEQTKPSQHIQKQSKQMQRYRVLNQTFYFLTEGQKILNQQKMNKRIQQLPLACIQALQPLMKQIYKGCQIQWVQFIQYFNSKLTKKQSFIKIMGNWLRRHKQHQY